MSLLFLDFETRSEADLPSVGAYRYAADPTTEILCAATQRVSAVLGYDVPELWRPEDGVAKAIIEASIFPGVMFVAHNAEFEKSIMREKLGIDLPIDRFIDTAAMSARMSLPRKLEEVARFFGLDTEAKDAGKKAINALSKPRRPTRKDPSKWVSREARPDLYAMLEARCVQDVEITRQIYHLLRPLEETERQIWQVTIEMNERGLLIDRPSIQIAHPILEREEAPLLVEFERLAGCKLKSYVKLAARCGLPDVGKSTVRKALRGETIRWEEEIDGEKKPFSTVVTDPNVKRILTIYQGLNKSSISKLDAMLDRMLMDDRVRGSFVYCGAERTGRWSANGIQPQNFPRGLGKETDLVFRAMRQEGMLSTLFEGCPRPSPEPPLTITSTISNSLRGFIIAPPGKTLVVGDLSQIEARTLNWLAGQDDTVKLFATGGDPYCAMASRIYGREVTKAQKDERFMGKQAVLGAGYGLGPGGFQFMLDETYDVQVDEEFAKKVVYAYREASPKVVAFWKRLNDGLVHVVAGKVEKVRVTRNIWMGVEEIGDVLYAWIQIPSGRKLYYAAPSLTSTPKGPAVRYYGRDRFSKGWTDVKTYGGKIAENVTQALSRDVMALAALRLKAALFELIGTVHDELIAEILEEMAEELAAEFHRIMVEVPEWAPGLPLEAEVFTSRRYRK